jgi:hypothetical protein
VAGRRLHPALLDTPYEHFRPHEEPLLSVADAVAWAYGAGGHWRTMVEQSIDKIVTVPC